jgi:hypothetical protein
MVRIKKVGRIHLATKGDLVVLKTHSRLSKAVIDCDPARRAGQSILQQVGGKPNTVIGPNAGTSTIQQGQPLLIVDPDPCPFQQLHDAKKKSLLLILGKNR